MGARLGGLIALAACHDPVHIKYPAEAQRLCCLRAGLGERSTLHRTQLLVSSLPWACPCGVASLRDPLISRHRRYRMQLLVSSLPWACPRGVASQRDRLIRRHRPRCLRHLCNRKRRRRVHQSRLELQNRCQHRQQTPWRCSCRTCSPQRPGLQPLQPHLSQTVPFLPKACLW